MYKNIISAICQFAILFILISCGNEVDEPTPVTPPPPPPPETKTFTLTVADNYYDYDHFFVLITDTNNERIDYAWLEDERVVELSLPANLDKFNVHYVREASGNAGIYSFFGYEQDEMFVYIPYPNTPADFDFGAVTHQAEVEVDPSISYYNMTLGPYDFDDNKYIWTDELVESKPWDMLDNASALFVIRRNEIDFNPDHAYYLDLEFNPSNKLVITENLLLPLSDLTGVTVTHSPNHIYFANANATALWKKNGAEQYPVTIYSKDGVFNSGSGAPPVVYFPEIDDFYGYRIQYRGRHRDENYSPDNSITYFSEMFTDSPALPQFIDASISINNYQPGEVELNATGTYNRYRYRILNDGIHWNVEVLDINADFNLFPDFPEEFHSTIPNKTIESLVDPTFFDATAEWADNNESRRVTKSLDL